MKILTTKPFDRDYEGLPESIRDTVDKKLQLFMENPHHPSLRIKKMEDPRDIWEGRISRSYRFTFQIQGDTYVLRRIGTHDILRTP